MRPMLLGGPEREGRQETPLAWKATAEATSLRDRLKSILAEATAR